MRRRPPRARRWCCRSSRRAPYVGRWLAARAAMCPRRDRSRRRGSSASRLPLVLGAGRAAIARHFARGAVAAVARDVRRQRFGDRRRTWRSCRAMASARAAGFEVVSTYPQRTALRLRGTAAEIEAYFGTPLLRVRPAVRYAPTGRPSDPSRPPTAAPLRSSPRSRGSTPPRCRLLWRRPALSAPRRPPDIPPDGLTPEQAATAYGITPLYEEGFTGQGETIALYSAATFDPADVERVRRAVRHRVAAGRADPGERRHRGTTGPLAGEVALDIDVIRGLAPRRADPELPGGIGASTRSPSRSPTWWTRSSPTGARRCCRSATGSPTRPTTAASRGSPRRTDCAASARSRRRPPPASRSSSRAATRARTRRSTSTRDASARPSRGPARARG